jgi:hypothetical protein
VRSGGARVQCLVCVDNVENTRIDLDYECGMNPRLHVKVKGKMES